MAIAIESKVEEIRTKSTETCESIMEAWCLISRQTLVAKLLQKIKITEKSSNCLIAITIIFLFQTHMCKTVENNSVKAQCASKFRTVMCSVIRSLFHTRPVKLCCASALDGLCEPPSSHQGGTLSITWKEDLGSLLLFTAFPLNSWSWPSLCTTFQLAFDHCSLSSHFSFSPLPPPLALPFVLDVVHGFPGLPQWYQLYYHQ